MTELRQYQRDVIAQVDEKIAQNKRRIIVVAPTGAGKTIIAAAIIKAAIADTLPRRTRHERACPRSHPRNHQANQREVIRTQYRSWNHSGRLPIAALGGSPDRVRADPLGPSNADKADGFAAGRHADHRRMSPLPRADIPEDHRRISQRGIDRPDGNAMPR